VANATSSFQRKFESRLIQNPKASDPSVRWNDERTGNAARSGLASPRGGHFHAPCRSV